MSGKKDRYLRYYYKNRDRLLSRRRDKYWENPDKARGIARKKYHKRGRYRSKELATERKKKAIDGYGGKCLFCGEDRIDGLIFHHVRGDGRQHREEVSGSRAQIFYKWIVDNNFPGGIVLLCGTCHLILHRAQEDYGNDNG